MKYHYPAHYRQFRCIGGACEDTCCGGWQIGIDQKSYLAYRRVSGAFGKRLRKEIDHKQRIFHLHGTACGFLNAVGLCDIYQELGEDALCRACQTYPRHREDYGDLQEVMLSLSCPEAARIILTDARYGRLLEKENEKKGEALADQDLLAALIGIRQTITAIVMDDKIEWDQRLAMILAFAHDAQRRLQDRSGMWETELNALAVRYQVNDAQARFEKCLKPFRNHPNERKIRVNAFVRDLSMLEPVVKDWKSTMEQMCHNLYHQQAGVYQTTEQAFHAQEAELENGWKNLVLYFVNTYVLGAVYDADVYSKVKFVVYSYLMIRERCIDAFQRHGNVEINDLVTASYLYSREVENSYPNLEQMDRMLQNGNLYGLESMLTALVG